MVKGRSGSAPLDALFPKVAASHCIHESTTEAQLSCGKDCLQIGVRRVLDLVEEFQPDTPAAIVLLMGLIGDSIFPGHFCARNTILEIYFCGSGMILSWCGERDLWRQVVSIETS